MKNDEASETCNIDVKRRNMNRLIHKLCLVLVAVIGVQCFAKDAAHPLPEGEQAAIKAFFTEFKDAFNSKDIERVKLMSGDTWDHWSKAIDEGKFESVEILDVVVDKQTNVFTKCIAVDNKKRTYPAEVVFTMKRDGGRYSIEKMRFPESERRNKVLDNGMDVIRKLIEAINKRDLDSVKDLVSFADAADFEAELSARELLWIKEAIDSGVNAQKYNMSASRDGKDIITGRLYVPCTPGGTNILRKVVFRDGKIDRAAPREGTKEEFLRRFEKEKAEARLRLEKEDAERERRQREEALKYLQKRMK